MSGKTVNDFLNGDLCAARYVVLEAQDFIKNKENARVIKHWKHLVGEDAPTKEERNEVQQNKYLCYGETAIIRALARTLIHDVFMEKQKSHTLRTGIPPPSPPPLPHYSGTKWTFSFEKQDGSALYDSRLEIITVVIEKELSIGGTAACFRCRYASSEATTATNSNTILASENNNCINVWIQFLIGIDTLYMCETWRGALHQQREITASVIWLNTKKTECFVADPLKT